MTDLKKTATVISVIIIAAILIGEIFICNFNAGSVYGSSSEMNENGLTCTVHSDIASTYTVMIIDNGEMRPSSEYYLFSDKDCKTALAENSEYEDCIEQLKYQLKKNNITPTEKNADDLSSSMRSDIANDTCNKSLIILAGAFPSTVYTGHTDDLIFKWLEKGGRVYWSGNIIGSYYSTADSICTVDNGQRLFFGTDCVNGTDVSKTTDAVTDNSFGKILCLQNNDVQYGIDISRIHDRGTLAFGFEKDGYASTAAVQFGKGMICVFGGELSTKMRTDMTQTIASGICWSTDLIASESGELVRTSHTTVSEFTPTDDYYSAFIFIGGYFTEYGQRYDFRNTSKL